MSHHHSHDAHKGPSELTVEEKLKKLLEHWVLHNEEHAQSYESWAGKAEDKGLLKMEALLAEAAERTRAISEIFKEAMATLKKRNGD